MLFQLGGVSWETFLFSEKNELSERIESTYPDAVTSNKTLYFNINWNLYHGIQEGDLILARRGRKTLEGVGKVIQTAYYSPNELSTLVENNKPAHKSFLGVKWLDSPKNKVYEQIVFGLQTLYEIPEAKYQELVGEEHVSEIEEGIEDQLAFVLEKYLEEFIVNNFRQIFNDELVLYREEGVVGRQYTTDIGRIDILARDPISDDFVVIELKKGHASDQVVGQTLRYMGWVQDNLCENQQGVKGLIICREEDDRLTYALRMIEYVDLRYYHIDFQLGDIPY